MASNMLGWPVLGSPLMAGQRGTFALVAAGPTGQSEELRALAHRIAAGHADEAADEVVLTGSVSRGLADEGSDVELLLVVPRLPQLTVAEVWVVAAGIEPTSPWESAELVYVAGRVQDTSVELIWFEEATIEALLEAAFAGQLVDHARLRSLEALEHGVALRGGRRLHAWQERLQAYPDELREALVRDSVDDWGGYTVDAYLRQAWRNDRYSNTRVVLEVTDDVLRLLFALNRRWEPSWKRIPELLAPLLLKPDPAAERIEAALAASDPRLALLTIFELARDAVALVGPEFDVSPARAWLDGAVARLQQQPVRVASASTASSLRPRFVGSSRTSSHSAARSGVALDLATTQRTVGYGVPKRGRRLFS
jgi:predicted nucleotidyltransferase